MFKETIEGFKWHQEISGTIEGISEGLTGGWRFQGCSWDVQSVSGALRSIQDDSKVISMGSSGFWEKVSRCFRDILGGI